MTRAAQNDLPDTDLEIMHYDRCASACFFLCVCALSTRY
jgi:hypothetical protein